MNAVTPLVTTAQLLVETAWSQTDFLGDLMPYSPGMRRLCQRSIAEAADILDDRGIPVTERDQRDAALLLEIQGNAYLDAQECVKADTLADEIEAGDRDRDGVVVGYTKYWGV